MPTSDPELISNGTLGAFLWPPASALKNPPFCIWEAWVVRGIEMMASYHSWKWLLLQPCIMFSTVLTKACVSLTTVCCDFVFSLAVSVTCSCSCRLMVKLSNIFFDDVAMADIISLASCNCMFALFFACLK